MIDLYFKLIVDAPELPPNDIYEVVIYIMDMTIKGHKERKESTESNTMISIFDYEKDYRFIWDSFKAKRGIDLNKGRVTWWEFTTILEAMRIEAIITPDSKSSLESLKSIRIWKESPDTDQARKQAKEQYNAFMRQLQIQYALENNEEQTEANNQGALSMLKDYIIANIDKK